MELTTQELAEIRNGLMARYVQPVMASSGYECCAGWPGCCPQHAQFWTYEMSHGYLGRAKVHPDDT